MTALGSIIVTLSLGVDSAPPSEVASVEVPVSAKVEGVAEGFVRIVLATAPDAFGKAIAGALRTVADRFDPDTEDPVAADLPDALAPGAVLLRCPSCPATLAGWPGESLEHADGGAHVWHPRLGVGS